MIFYFKIQTSFGKEKKKNPELVNLDLNKHLSTRILKFLKENQSQYSIRD